MDSQGCGQQQRGHLVTSLSDLPEELFQCILHAGGRSARRVCRQWHAAYGPLYCGLLLTDPTSRRNLFALPRHLSSIRTLALAASPLPRPPPQPSPRGRPQPSSITVALTRAFPRLTSLDLQAALLSTPHASHPPLAPHLQSLAPLRPHLTSLTLRHIDLDTQPITALPTALPTLLALTLTLVSVEAAPQLVATLTTLRALSHLQHLSLVCPEICSGTLTTADILPLLAALPPTLTHLDLHVCDLTADHTPHDLAPLHTALPSLRTLHLALHLADYLTLDSSLDTLTAALSQRQALTRIHLDLDFGLGLGPLSHSAQTLAHLARLRSLRSLHLGLGLFPSPSDVAAVVEHAAPALSATTSLTSLVLAAHSAGNARELARLWPPLAPTLLHLDLSRGVLTQPMVAGLAPLTALQSLSLPTHADLIKTWGAAATRQAVEALLSLTRLTHLDACSTDFASHLLAGIGRLPALRQLVAMPVGDAQATSGLASASSTLTSVKMYCWKCSIATIVRAAAALPPSVRCLGLLEVSDGLGAKLAREIRRRGGQGLLPLPNGLRVLALGADTLRALSWQVPAALEAAARRQDCVVVGELPRKERHFGGNGYL